MPRQETHCSNNVEERFNKRGDGDGTYPLELGHSKNAGRFVVCTRAIAKGDVVFRAQPYAVVVTDEFMSSRCAHCLRNVHDGTLFHSVHQTTTSRKEGPSAQFQPMPCQGCRFTTYCSLECQASDRPLHQLAECQAVSRLYSAGESETPLLPTLSDPSVQRADVRLVIRVFMRKLLESAGKQPNEGLLFEDVDALVCNQELFDSVELQSNVEIADVTLAYIDNVPELKTVCNDRDVIVALLCKYDCNAFGFHNRNGEEEGIAVYPFASFFNHSCAPNMAKWYEGTTMCFRALREISPGEELNISYVDCNDNTEARREKLQHAYCFKCMCPRCCTNSSEADEEFIGRFMCSNRAQCSGLMICIAESGIRQCNTCFLVQPLCDR